MEAAETFSLGRTMWMPLQRIPEAQLEVEEEIPVQRDDDIPESWKGDGEPMS